MGGPFSWNLADPIKILARFRTTLPLDCKYLRNATRHRQSENGVANYGHSYTGKLNLVYFGRQMEKIGPEFWPTQRVVIRLDIALHLVAVWKLQDVMGKIHTNLHRSAQTQKLFAAIESRDRSIVETNFERVNFWSTVQMIAMVTAAAVNVVVIRHLFNDRRTAATGTKLRT